MSERAETTTHSADETRQLGAELGQRLEPGDVLLLVGQFGAGKTTLVQGIARGLGFEGPVTSPSFVIANEYPGRLPLYHVDLYRVEQMDRPTLEALSDYFGEEGACAVEWPDSLPEQLIAGASRLELTIIGENQRRISLETGEERLREVFLARMPARR